MTRKRIAVWVVAACLGLLVPGLTADPTPSASCCTARAIGAAPCTCGAELPRAAVPAGSPCLVAAPALLAPPTSRAYGGVVEAGPVAPLAMFGPALGRAPPAS